VDQFLTSKVARANHKLHPLHLPILQHLGNLNNVVKIWQQIHQTKQTTKIMLN